MVGITDSNSGKRKFIRGKGKRKELPLEAFETPPVNSYDNRINGLIRTLEVKAAAEKKAAEKKSKRKSKKAKPKRGKL